MRRALPILGAVILIALVVWFVSRRDRAAESPRTAPSATRPSSTPRPELPGAPPPPPDGARRSTRPPEQPQVNPPDIQARMQEVHAHLQDVAKPCGSLVTKRPAADAQFRFAYRLTVANGEASISDVDLVWTDLASPGAEKCLLEKLAAAKWSTSEPDFTTTVEDALIFAELD